MNIIKILLIIHSRKTLQLVTKAIEDNKQYQIIATATNGVEGFYKVIKYSPDIIILDIDIPAMNGTKVLNNILDYQSIPILVLTRGIQQGKQVMNQALNKDCVTIIEKPQGKMDSYQPSFSFHFVQKIERLIEKPVEESKVLESTNPIQSNKRDSFIVIGTSTGGPRALQTVLTNLPDDFQTPILIVQHMPSGFTKSLAKRLNFLTSLQVKEAVDKEVIVNGTVYIAPGGKHMEIQKLDSSFHIQLTELSPVNGHRPSVDVLFRSLAKMKNVNKIAVILTGMGKDGAEGVKLLKKQDKETIIINQSKETSIVYGMPKAVDDTNLVDYTVPLTQVSDKLVYVIEMLGGDKNGY